MHSPLRARDPGDLPTCNECSANQYAPGGVAGEGNIAADGDGLIVEACRDCPPYSTSPAGSASVAACECNAGYSALPAPFADACWHCAAFKFKTAAGSAACEDCPANTQQNLLAQTTATACKCNAGYTGIITDAATDECAACAPGTFKAAPGEAACAPCAPCAPNEYQPNAAATASLVCPAHSTAPPGSDARADCVCDDGFGPDGAGNCARCAAGTFSADGAPCAPCPTN